MAEKIIGCIYKDDAEAEKHQVDIKHPFHDDEETFEIYCCPRCNGHFLVESEAMEGISKIFCPYCKTQFRNVEDVPKPRRWRYTNPETKETYLFEKKDGVIRTVAFLGYKAWNGKLIQKPGAVEKK